MTAPPALPQLTVDELTRQSMRVLAASADLITTEGWNQENYHWYPADGTSPVGPFCLAGAINRMCYGRNWERRCNGGSYVFGVAQHMALAAKYALLATHYPRRVIGTLRPDNPCFLDGDVASLNDKRLRSPGEALAALLAVDEPMMRLAAGRVDLAHAKWQAELREATELRRPFAMNITVTKPPAGGSLTANHPAADPAVHFEADA